MNKFGPERWFVKKSKVEMYKRKTTAKRMPREDPGYLHCRGITFNKQGLPNFLAVDNFLVFLLHRVFDLNVERAYSEI